MDPCKVKRQETSARIFKLAIHDALTTRLCKVSKFASSLEKGNKKKVLGTKVNQVHDDKSSVLKNVLSKNSGPEYGSHDECRELEEFALPIFNKEIKDLFCHSKESFKVVETNQNVGNETNPFVMDLSLISNLNESCGTNKQNFFSSVNKYPSCSSAMSFNLESEHEFSLNDEYNLPLNEKSLSAMSCNLESEHEFSLNNEYNLPLNFEPNEGYIIVNELHNKQHNTGTNDNSFLEKHFEGLFDDFNPDTLFNTLKENGAKEHIITRAQSDDAFLNCVETRDQRQNLVSGNLLGHKNLHMSLSHDSGFTEKSVSSSNSENVQPDCFYSSLSVSSSNLSVFENKSKYFVEYETSRINNLIDEFKML